MATFTSKALARPPLLTSFPLEALVLLLIAIALVHAVGGSDQHGLGDTLGLPGLFNDSNSNQSLTCPSPIPPFVLPIYGIDIDLLQFAQNLEHLESDFFLWGALGYGLDVVAPGLTLGGPSPIGVRKANLDTLVGSIIKEFAFEEVGHLRALKGTVGGIQRPLMDLNPQNFAKIVDQAFGHPLVPPFDPYRDSLSFMMASYIVPYVGLNGYVGANPQIKGYVSKGLLAGLLGVEAGQDAVIRMYLYERANQMAYPYNFTVGEYTDKISTLRNKLGLCGIKDEGVVVPPAFGAEGQSTTNVLAADQNSVAYARTPEEILRITYGTGDEHLPGGFYPKGGNGRIARSYLQGA